VPLELGARDARLLRRRHVQRQSASNDQRRCAMIRFVFTRPPCLCTRAALYVSQAPGYLHQQFVVVGTGVVNP
jgi:hypothetical protein